MTIPSTARKAGPYIGTAAQTAWPFTFKVFAPEDIAVVVLNSTGVETTLALNTDYSVTLNPNQDTSPGGTVTYPLTGNPLQIGSKLTIIGDLDYDQPLDLLDGGNFDPEAIENELDRIVMQIQQLREAVQRTIRVSVSTNTALNVTLPSPVPEHVIGWDQTGTAMRNYSLSDLVVTGVFADWLADTFTGDGIETTFGLQRAPGTVGNCDVSVDGQTYVPYVDFTVSGNALTFAVPPAAGAQILARYGSSAPQAPLVGAYLQHEEKIAGAGQTAFTLTNTYQTGIGSLSVYVNGQRATIGYDYLETNSTTVTFTSGLKAGDRVLFIVGIEVTTGTPGRGITSVDRTDGTGAPGTTDTYTITYSDATTSVFYVYNGANGTGTGDVVGPAGAVNNRIPLFDGTTGKLIKDSGVLLSDLGDVDGPAGAVNNRLAVFDGTTGKLIKDGGVTVADLATADHSHASSAITHAAAGTGAVSTTVQAKLRTVVSVVDYGAVADDATDCSTAFTNALAAAVAAGHKRVYVPGAASNYYLASTFTIGTSGVLFFGDGQYATKIRSGSSAEAVSVSSGLSGVIIRDMQITRTAGTASSGKDGIKFVTLTEQARVENVLLSRHWIGLSLCATSYSFVKEIIARDNYSHGVQVANNASYAGLQWSFFKCLAQTNNGYGLYVTTASGAASASVGDTVMFSTYANKLGGVKFAGTATSPINAIRWFGGFIGEDGGNGLELDTYGASNHKIEGLFAEIAGTSACGVDMSTAAPNVGIGILVTANNTWVDLYNCAVVGNSYTGIDMSATRFHIAGCDVRLNGAANVLGQKNGIRCRAGQGHVTGTVVKGHGSFGVFLDVDSMSIVGNDLRENTTALGATPSLVASTILGNMGTTVPNNITNDINRDGVKVLGTRATGWAAMTGTATRTTAATGSVTTAQLAERVKALIDDLITHGIIGA